MQSKSSIVTRVSKVAFVVLSPEKFAEILSIYHVDDVGFYKKNIFLSLTQGRYLLPLNSQNRYLTRSSDEKLIFTTAPGNLSVARYGELLVTMLLFDFVMIHEIQRKSFRKTLIQLISNRKIPAQQTNRILLLYDKSNCTLFNEDSYQFLFFMDIY